MMAIDGIKIQKNQSRNASVLGLMDFECGESAVETLEYIATTQFLR